MNDRAKDHPLNRIGGLLRRRRAGSDLPIGPAHLAGPLAAPVTAGDDGASEDPPSWALEPARTPSLEGAEYHYRLGRHGLTLALHGVPGRHEAAVGRAEAEFALVVEGPLLVF